MKKSIAKKTLLLLALLATILCALSGLTACGGDEDDNYNLEYTLSDDGTYYIVSGIETKNRISTRFGNDEKGNYFDVVIPSTYNDLPVQEIGRAFYSNNRLVSVVIPDSVTTINDQAFYNCKSLVSVTLGSGVTSIGNYSFWECDKLVEVYNLSGLYISKEETTCGYVGAYALSIHTSLDEASILTKQDYYIFSTYNSSYYLLDYVGSYTDLTLPELTIDGNTKPYSLYKYSLSSGVYRLESIILPDNLKGIGEYAFYDCSSITEITIPSSVTYIEENAFNGCSSLTSVTFEDTKDWYVTEATETDRTSVNVTDASQNATYLKSTYLDYSWRKI